MLSKAQNVYIKILKDINVTAFERKDFNDIERNTKNDRLEQQPKKLLYKFALHRNPNYRLKAITKANLM